MEGTSGRDWSETLFLPKTDFPMKAGLPALEPRLLERWERMGLYERLRETSKGRDKFLLHDGPPYANGNIHIGTALNKILKDLVVRSQQLLGKDSNYVPGWDCHGLPIEWKIEEQYRAKGKSKDDVPAAEFRKECRDFATHWLNVQREEFKRLGVVGDWDHPYMTMAPKAEATIAGELMKFALNGLLYRGSKPVMWSVVERTALAEAEVEYHDYQSDTIWVKFPVVPDHAGGSGAIVREKGAEPGAHDLVGRLLGASIVIWTTTPWTIPGNRAIAYSSRIAYGLYEVTKAPDGNWAKAGDKLVLADTLAAEVMKAAKVEEFRKLGAVAVDELEAITCAHPLRGLAGGYAFDIPLLDGDHVSDDTGTGFVHTAPGHGREDFDIWTASGRELQARGIDTAIPFTVDADGCFTKDAPGFTGHRVIDDKGNKGDANDAVIKALVAAGALIARGRLKHQYPHSWRSKKPVIFRNTPQWFIAMDKAITDEGIDLLFAGEARIGDGHLNAKVDTLRFRALKAIKDTEWVPAVGENRITGMIEAKPDWVLSRQRAWGVPITVFVHRETGEVLPNGTKQRAKLSRSLVERITSAMARDGVEAWFADGARERFLDGLVDDPAEWDQVTDILDVWFESGSTHAFTLEDPEAFPGLAGLKRVRDGGRDRVMYLEGSDQHRGWFHSSLLESCGTRGRAPFDVVLTHGFVLDEKGQKMSKSLGNTVAPQDVIKQSGADILRLWVGASDYSDDLRIGPEILKTFVESYRKIRNTLRWMLGTLAHHETGGKLKAPKHYPELEQLMLHRLHEIGETVEAAYAAYDYKTVIGTLAPFMNTALSAFYFDIRKDTLYCDPPSSGKRRAALAVIEQIFRCVTVWLAPILCFTAEEAWQSRYPDEAGSVHLETLPKLPRSWRNEKLADKWEAVRRIRSAVTGALEIERREKRIGSSLEAAPVITIDDAETAAVLDGIDLAELCITSQATLKVGKLPKDAFRSDEVRHVAVEPRRAEGRKCERSWRVLPEVGSDPDYPTLSLRDAAAMREIDGRPAGRGRS
ncbi:MAG: isoleucine--tRNA ligase [Hyphomicrobiaceae bacterium]